MTSNVQLNTALFETIAW